MYGLRSCALKYLYRVQSCIVGNFRKSDELYIVGFDNAVLLIVSKLRCCIREHVSISM